MSFYRYWKATLISLMALPAALLLTLISGFRTGTWSTGYVGGTGKGFPALYGREATTSDMLGANGQPIVGEAERQLAEQLSAKAFAVDYLFWLAVTAIVMLTTYYWVKDHQNRKGRKKRKKK